ncbi:hypothetical protein HU200_043456 [Digitaria exilis]|uniref:Uncharacterized protein n=1 Tax=Digitaria exilis TaxID=1010633 RepID=A0A835BB34_9POAL|nr:hypothetical protein HU200_043456 [Digitaria exilis]
MADVHGSASDDVHTQVVTRRLVKASNTTTAPHVLAVSNLDLLYSNFTVSFLCVYRRPPAGDFDAVVASFEAALPSFLNHFLPFAGRVVTDPTSGLPEIHCNNDGAELVVGHADTALDYFSRVGSSLFKIRLPYDAAIALSVQLVSFACGGFSVAWCSSHLLVDGCAISMLIGMWSEFMRTGGRKLSVVPSHDRRSVLLRPRSPPSFGDAYTPADSRDRLVNVLANQCFVERLYYIDAGDVERLRRAASRDRDDAATRMEAVSVYLWKALAAVVADDDERCRMGWWVDRRRCFAGGSMMRGYVGNVTSFAVREASVEEIRRAAAPDVAAMVREAVAATAREEHFRELVDWLEEHKARRYLEATFRPETDFGFGKAVMAMPMELRGRQCSGYMVVAEHPGGDRSLFVSAFVWPQLAAALESDDGHVLKPVTAEYLGFKPCSKKFTAGNSVRSATKIRASKI